jgi:hypothetical protein
MIQAPDYFDTESLGAGLKARFNSSSRGEPELPRITLSYRPPPFGHLLPMKYRKKAIVFAFSRLFRREKVPEGRMRGSNSIGTRIT